MSSWTNLRSWLKPTDPRTAPARLRLESLESRETPTITVVNNPIAGPQPAWEAVGPTEIRTNGSPGNDEQTGAVESIAIDPFNPNRAVIGAVNGGVWVTNNFNVPNPLWTTTTDALPSLAISTVAFNPVQPNVIYAGTGSFTAGGLGEFFSASITNPGSGGAAVGLYRSTDGGATWSNLGGGTFNGLRITNVLPTRLNGGNTIFVSVSDDPAGPTSTDVFRSDNGGASWVRISNVDQLPNNRVTSITADPANPNRFYAGLVNDQTLANPTGAGIYMLDLSGGSTVWVNITGNLPAAAVANSPRILLSASPAGVRPLYAAVIGTNGAPQGVYRGVQFGSTFIWTSIGPGALPPDVSPGGQAEIHFAIVADPTTDRFVYVGGDRIDTPPYDGNVARGDALADTWTTISRLPTPPPPTSPGTAPPLNPAPQPTTAPHADIRWLVFAGNNSILCGADGGVYQVVNPRAENGQPPVWTSLNSNLQISELYDSAMDNRQNTDPTDDVVLHAAQDNGAGDGRFATGFDDVSGGDGTIALADTQNGFRYFSAQGFAVRRRNPDGTISTPAATVQGTAGTINFYNGAPLVESLPFLTAAELNRRDNNVVLVGGFQTLYLSLNNMDTFRSIGGVTGQTPNPVPNITGTVTAIAFGTTQVPFAAYVATDDGNIARSFDASAIVGSGNFVLTNFQTVAQGGQTYNIVMDPDNPLIAYAVTDKGVFRTTNGFAWTNVTGNLLGLIQQGGLNSLYAVELFNNGTTSPNDDSLLVGAYGGVFQLRQTPLFTGGWTKLGSGMPNVVVSELQYDAQSDTVTAGTWGRGIWRLPNATAPLLDNGITVVSTGNNSANTMAVYTDPNVPGNFIVTDGVGGLQSFDKTIYRRVQFRGLGGADTIYVGTPNAGTPGVTSNLSQAISVDAGSTAGDTLIIDNSGDFQTRTATGTPISLGNGTTDNIFLKGGKVTWTGLNLGSTRIQFGSGFDNYTIDDSATPIAVGYTLTPTRYSRNVGGSPIDYSGVERMTLVGGAGANLYAINGTGASLTTTVFDGNGSSTFNVQGTGLTGQNTFIGGNGSDLMNLFGKAANDNVTFTMTDLNSTVAGTGSLGTLGFQTFETLNFNGNGGVDDFLWADGTNTVFGTATDPDSGIAYLPGAGLSGTIKVRRGAVLPIVTFEQLTGSLSVSGDSDGSGDTDVLAVYGISDNGLQSAIGEVTGENGQDTIVATDSLITLASATYGTLRSINVGTTPGGAGSFSSVFVRTGNEGGATGDLVTAVPSTTLNLVIDGMGPVGAQPGDRLNVQIVGPQTRTATSDPAFGPPQIRIVQDMDNASVGSIGFESSGGPGSSVIAVASDAGGFETRVRVFDAVTNELKFELVPFPGFAGGATVAAGD
ncbi:MAG TPA: hypothetical protein VMZ71_16965, partial [Gemmataceae bacterium]|nr:hypothetical protein [Gemmataceae bacterium]